MDKGQRAFRSTTQLALPPEETEVIPDEQAKIDKEQDQSNAKYASLNGHPGWELIRKDFELTISNYRSGAVLKSAIQQGVTDAELGAMTRTTNAIADELEQKILTVEAAAVALEEDKNGRRKSKGL